MKVSVHPKAEQELLDGRDFYQAQVGGRLAAQFIAEYDRLATLLIKYPGFGTPFGAGIRKQPMKQFPYNIMYRVDGEVVRIVSVAHQSRLPRYWTGRV
jgi:toxin ParE1/3/4